MGKVITSSLSKIREHEAGLKLFIVLRPGTVSIKGLHHKPDLAPSKELFLWAQEHKHEPGWFQTYAQWFRRDMEQRPGLRAALNQIETLAATQDVLLVCFCADPYQCHRSLIAQELQRRGVTVELY